MRCCPTCGRLLGDDWRCRDCPWEPGRAGGFLAFAPELDVASSVDSIDFDMLAAVEDASFWFQARNRLIVWALQRYVPGMKSMLEIGCGTGFVLNGVRRSFPGATLSGSEASFRGLGFAATRNPGVALYQMDARAIPFRDEFDVIGAFDVLEHVEEDERVLASIRKALKAHGSVIISVPQHRFLWSTVDEVAGHVRRYGRRELVGKLRGTGFRITMATSFVSLLFPALLASRLMRRQARGENIAGEEFSISPGRSKVLGLIMDFERLLIRAGCRLPVGGSLLVIARKDS